MDQFRTNKISSEAEQANRDELVSLLENSPLPRGEVLNNLGLFVRRQVLSRYLFLNEIYQQILDVQGVVIEFGVRWGQNMSLFQSLRGIHEPFNHQRRIVGFDTFEGFPSVHEKDGHDAAVAQGAYGVTGGYESFLERLLACQERESPISHIRKFELHKGDASVKIKEYLKENNHAVVALAYFDMDLYQPTHDCLRAIADRLTKGSVVAFDEVNNKAFPGETQALKEVLGLGRYKIRCSRYAPSQSYIVID